MGQLPSPRLENIPEEPWTSLVHKFMITPFIVAVSGPVMNPLLYKRESSTALEGGGFGEEEKEKEEKKEEKRGEG